MSGVPPDTAPRRLVVVDGLRAIAAPMVAWLHIHETTPGLRAWLPDALNAFFAHFGTGVQVFFVVSGFAIAQSLVGVAPGAGTFGRFLLKRVVRLDPPFWTSMALAMVVFRLADVVLGRAPAPLPSAAALVAHATYTLPFTGHAMLLDVYWTLMVEFQFYLVFFLLHALSHGLQRRGAVMAAVPLLAMTGWSVSVRAGWMPLPVGGLGLWLHWPTFMLGIALSYLHQRRWPAWTVACALAASFVRTGAPAVPDAVGAVAALLVWAALATGQGSRWLGGRRVQWFAAISYSLYLVHPLFGQRAGNLLARMLGTSGPMPLFIALAGMTLSVGAAWLMCRLVEQPALRLSRRIGRGRHDPAAG